MNEELRNEIVRRRQAAPRCDASLESRSRKRSTAVATNIDFDGWADYLGDAPLATAFLDRVVNGAIILKIKGKSYRAYRANMPPTGPTPKG